MTQLDNEELTGRLGRLANRLPELHQELNLVALYVDEPARLWAAAAKDRTEGLAGRRPIRSTWWKLADLYQPGVLAAAVSRTLRADIIMVATSATEGLPLPFYFWVNAWLPHYPRGTGALIGLLGKAAELPEAGRIRRYLQAVARRARMDLLLEEHGR